MSSTDETKRRLKVLLAENQERPLPTLVPREFDLELLQASKVLTLVGPRRAGKTFLCHQIIHHWLSQGIPRKRILYLNFEDERLYPLSGQELTLLLDVYEEIEEWNNTEPLYIVLDEIQNVPQWSRWTRRITEQYPSLRLILTGSSSKLLSTEMATELRGRALSFSVYPYSFRERCLAEGESTTLSKATLYGRQKNRMLRLFHRFLANGGFPEACVQKNPRPLLQSYYQPMFMRDLVERYRIKHVMLFEEFLKIAISRFSSLFSVSSIYQELEARHGKISKATLIQYLRYAHEIFILFEMNRYDTKIRKQLVYPRKIYGIDTGLLNAIRFSTSDDQGRLLENAVYLELLRRGGELYYWKGQEECDFLVKHGPRVNQAIQVCWSLENKQTRQREMDSLVEALTTFRLKEGLILTSDEAGEVQYHKKKIIFQPFWYWALRPENTKLREKSLS